MIDFAPGMNQKELDKEITLILQKNNKKTVVNSLASLLPVKLITALIDNAGIDLKKQSAQISNKEKERIIRNIKSTELSVLNIS